MALFSERLGFEEKQLLQVDRIDQPLRNRLWSIFDLLYFRDWSDTYHDINASTAAAEQVQRTMRMLWMNFYKQPADTYPGPQQFMSTLRNSVLRGEPWHRVYNALEAFLEIMKEDKREIDIT